MKRHLLKLTTFLLITLTIFTFSSTPAQAVSSASRTLPATYTPGTPVTVTINATVDSTICSWIVEEIPPTGWTIVPSNGGFLRPTDGHILWDGDGPACNAAPTTFAVSYTATPPIGTTGPKTFAGFFDVSGASYLRTTIVGATTINQQTTTTDPTAPLVSLTTPANNATVSGTINLTATASDPVVAGQPTSGVATVEFYLDGTLLGSDTTAPYAYSWNTTTTTDGPHTLTAQAFDVALNVGNSLAVNVTVGNAPIVNITAPLAGATVAGTVAISATATDASGVARVDFYRGTTLLEVDTTFPFSYNWNTNNGTSPNGSYALTAKAYDPLRNVGTSPIISVMVNNPIIALSILKTSVTNVTTTSARVNWKTNRAATGLVRYGTDSSNLNLMVKTILGGTNQFVDLNNLSSNQRYYYVITASLKGSNVNSPMYSFRTRVR